MIIDKETWHYKLWRLSWWDTNYSFASVPEHTNLCSYFWRLVIVIVGSPLLLAAAIGWLMLLTAFFSVVLSVSLVFGLFVAPIRLSRGMKIKESKKPWNRMEAEIPCYWADLPRRTKINKWFMWLSCILMPGDADIYWEYKEGREPQEKEEVKKEPSIVVLRFQAWKEKKCPLISFSESETSSVTAEDSTLES